MAIFHTSQVRRLRAAQYTPSDSSSIVFLALAVLLITAGCAFSQGDEKRLENEHQNIKKVEKKAVLIARIRAIREIVYKQPRINKIWKKCTSNEIFLKIVFETDPILKSTAIDQALNHPGNMELLES